MLTTPRSRGRGHVAAGVAALMVLPSVAYGHGGITTGPWWAQWQVDPLIASNLAFAAGLYWLGWRRRRRLGNFPASIRPWRAWCFVVAILLLVVALLSPMDAFADELLWVHMVQHMVLMNLAAPLLMLAAPGRVWWWSLADERRLEWARVQRQAGRWGWPTDLLWRPLLLWLLYAVILWLWHWPALYEAALLYPRLHDLQHLTFFGAAVLFWRVLFEPLGRRMIGRLRALLYLFTTSLHAALLGAFMTLAPGLWYPIYADRAPRWGWDPLQDQQLAGYIMWMPACMAYVVVAAVLVALALVEPEREPALRATHT
jgi:putative membrane protein